MIFYTYGILSHTHTHLIGFLCTHTQLGEKLHSQMISLVGRLHETELQTHSLHSQLIQSHSHREDLTRELHEAKKMKENVESLQTELAMMVPHGQFEGICKDLEASLKREKELKIYLSQHVAAVEQLQTKLQLASQDVQSKESSISQSRKVSKDIVVIFCVLCGIGNFVLLSEPSRYRRFMSYGSTSNTRSTSSQP